MSDLLSSLVAGTAQRVTHCAQERGLDGIDTRIRRGGKSSACEDQLRAAEVIGDFHRDSGSVGTGAQRDFPHPRFCRSAGA